MPTDKQDQEETARRLREQIEKLKRSTETPSTPEDLTSPKKSKSLREAIQERMRELDGESHN